MLAAASLGVAEGLLVLGEMEGLWVLGLFGAIIAFGIFMIYFPVTLWVSAIAADVWISPITLITMRLRGVDQGAIIRPLIQGKKAGITLSLDAMEAHYLAQGHVDRVVNSLISASKANIPLDFQQASAIDLAGRNVYEAVAMCVQPKVIVTPMVAGMAKDGIEIKATSRVTVKAKIEKLVGGAGEETIIARVGEGICTTIGSADSHKDILENPDRISSVILAKGLDTGTAFEILSIDIADVDVGRNVGAQLQIDQAEADKKIAQAKAEERRAMAQAEHQEMIAREQEMRAKVVEAEAQIPMAMAEAFRSGNMGIMDYYKLQNVKADTSMRSGFAKMGGRS